MPHNRYYTDTPFAENAHVTLSDEECHHLVRVLRARPGDRIELVNGRGQLAYARLSEVAKHSAQVLIERIVQEPPKAPLILAMGIPTDEPFGMDHRKRH